MINNTPLISIIVPVYNVEKYLSKCIESILHQTYKNWELLLIDDGSHDNSGKICDEYALNDSRIKVFHKANGGVSSARNLGLEKALGDFIMFVDSDDWIGEKCLEICTKEIIENDLDALQFGFTAVFPNQETPRIKESTSILNGGEYIQTNSFNVCVWGGIYKKKIIDDYKLKFIQQLKLAEDQIFTLNFFKHTQRIKYIDKPMYYYLQRMDSAIHTQKSNDMLLSCEYLMKFSQDWLISKSFVDNMIVQFIIHMIENGDVPYKTLKGIYKKQKICKIDSSYRLQHLFSKLATYNFALAYCIISLYFKIQC